MLQDFYIFFYTFLTTIAFKKFVGSNSANPKSVPGIPPVTWPDFFSVKKIFFRIKNLTLKDRSSPWHPLTPWIRVASVLWFASAASAAVMWSWIAAHSSYLKGKKKNIHCSLDWNLCTTRHSVLKLHCWRCHCCQLLLEATIGTSTSVFRGAVQNFFFS